jgi:hypothetical protein
LKLINGLVDRTTVKSLSVAVMLTLPPALTVLPEAVLAVVELVLLDWLVPTLTVSLTPAAAELTHTNSANTSKRT